MSHTAAARAAIGADKPTATGILALIQGIERHGLAAPAAIAFKGALARAGREVDAAGGLEALDAMMVEISAADPDRADARLALLRGVWGELLPGPGGRARA